MMNTNPTSTTSEPAPATCAQSPKRCIVRASLAPILASLLTAAAAVALTSCNSPGGMYGHMAVTTAPAKPARTASSDLAAQGKAAFWRVFQAGSYDRAHEALVPLTAAYIDFPYDPELALLIAHTHLWRVAERARSDAAADDPRITDELVLARYYFDQAARLDPQDHRIDGWLASCDLALGAVHNEQRFTRRGYFTLKDAWRDHPAFNGFTFGHNLGATARDSDTFADALDAMWSSVHRCSRGRTTPEEPSSGGPPNPAALAEVDPACWNSNKAPHNYEGFWWALALMELKAGRTAIADACFENARSSPTFSAWPYRAEMERDAAESADLAAAFASEKPWPEDRLLFNAPHACTACHQTAPNPM